VPQNSHLVNPPEFEIVDRAVKESPRETRPYQAATAYSKLRLLAKRGVTAANRTTQVQSSFDPTMRKAFLLYNPNSGGTRSRRQGDVESVVALLRDANVDAQLVLTDSPAEAEQHARQAVQSGCDTVFACGGDGTIHTILQVLANTSVALAILPMGTANALAHDLQLPMKLTEAARSALHGEPRRVALGRIQYRDLRGNPGTRFFAVAAGAGVDAHLFYKLHTGTKQRMGMAAYYSKAWQLWFNYPMTRFRVEISQTGSDELRRAEVTELMAIRIRNFGGVLQELAPGASLDRQDVRVVLCRTSSRLAYLLYVTRGFLHRNWKIPGIELAYSHQILCQYQHNSHSGADTPNPPKIYVETDGELVGTLPAEITVVRDALTLLAPRR
jgi:diacylglycerol kinase (ATP)